MYAFSYTANVVVFLRTDANGCLIYELCNSIALNHASAKCTNPLSVDLKKEARALHTLSTLKMKI